MPATPVPSSPAMSAPPVQAFEAGVELPAGQGREILVSACLGCHELTALELFRGFYTRDSWRSLVVTMRANGAQLADADVDLLADYLAEHFGRDFP
jgi:mono/diheme cytochrome c family protein